MDQVVTQEVLIAVCSALCEQLDLDRLVVALRRQHDTYAASERPAAQAVAETIGEIGAALTSVAATRQKKAGPPH
jgi:hypothetical protein